ncbi:MAG: tRNA epoxyqueuosine(34) reductase QueG [Acidimicrobiia bacterium]
MSLRDDVLAAGRVAGLAGVGVCAAEPFSDVEENLRDAVASGRSAGMRFTFGTPERSSDVTASFAWARSLVVGAHAYLPAAGNPIPGDGEGRVARFAVSDHYAPLREALTTIADLLRARGHEAQMLADDSRLVDRAAAVRAGVAWWGKNTMALIPGYGPWVLLGSVVTDAIIDSDEPMRRTCGTCEACLPACPTGALIEPGILDARRCIAYLLQSPGNIPEGFREAVGDRFYGCDDCLDACPPGAPLVRRSPDTTETPDMAAVLESSDEELLDRFRRFYIPERDPAFLRRNALVVLGNVGDRSHRSLVAGFAASDDPMLSEHARWALARIDERLAGAC